MLIVFRSSAGEWLEYIVLCEMTKGIFNVWSYWQPV